MGRGTPKHSVYMGVSGPNTFLMVRDYFFEGGVVRHISLNYGGKPPSVANVWFDSAAQYNLKKSELEGTALETSNASNFNSYPKG